MWPNGLYTRLRVFTHTEAAALGGVTEGEDAEDCNEPLIQFARWVALDGSSLTSELALSTLPLPATTSLSSLSGTVD